MRNQRKKAGTSTGCSCFAADFETTVYEGQTRTDVWAAGIAELYTEKADIFTSIEQFFSYVTGLKDSAIIYFHNLKFDGHFIVNYFIKCGYKQAYTEDGQEIPNKSMKNYTWKYVITDKGQWYRISFKVNKKIIEFRDSMKLLPMSLKEVGRSFKTKHQKLEMEYKGYREPNGEILPHDREYILNDVLVLKEGLEQCFNDGHTRLTIGSCCLHEFKEGYWRDEYDELFPNPEELSLPESFKYSTVGQYCRAGYKGGYCYVKKGYEGKVINSLGVTADVNSLYPYVMSSCSGNWYPVGIPNTLEPHQIPFKDSPERIVEFINLCGNATFFYIRFICSFELKKGYLPTVQIKGNFLYPPNEWLETSRVKIDGDYYDELTMPDGEVYPTTVELVMTEPDFEIFVEHYNISNFKVLDALEFKTEFRIFDKYLNKYIEQKENSAGGKRTIAKLYQNNLYGKMATSPKNKMKRIHDDETHGITFTEEQLEDKQSGYIPIGAAITAYARCYTIRTAQKNYKYFRYADTDSIHCECKPSDLVGVSVHPKKLGYWKLEATWDKAIFTRQKTYIEHVVAENLTPIEIPYHNIRCAGMTNRPKELLNYALKKDWQQARDIYELEFLMRPIDYKDFKQGLTIPNNLKPKRIPGGVILVEQPFEMK